MKRLVNVIKTNQGLPMSVEHSLDNEYDEVVVEPMLNDEGLPKIFYYRCFVIDDK